MDELTTDMRKARGAAWCPLSVSSRRGSSLSRHPALSQVMEPYTAKNLKERKENKLKDFIHVAGPLGAFASLRASQPC